MVPTSQVHFSGSGLDGAARERGWQMRRHVDTFLLYLNCESHDIHSSTDFTPMRIVYMYPRQN